MSIPIPEDPSYTLLSIPVVAHAAPISWAPTLLHSIPYLTSLSLATGPMATYDNH